MKVDQLRLSSLKGKKKSPSFMLQVGRGLVGGKIDVFFKRKRGGGGVNFDKKKKKKEKRWKNEQSLKYLCD